MPHADPAVRRAYQQAYNARTKEHRNALHREWKRRNPDAVRQYARKAYAANPAKYKAKCRAYAVKNKTWALPRAKDYQRKYLYGMSPGEFAAMLVAQQDACAGCGTAIAGSTAHVDHCHETKRVRGLLCRKCNLALGHTNDDPHILRRLAAYLEKET